MEQLLKKEIEAIGIKNKTKEILKQNNINLVYDICEKSRMELSHMGLTSNQINELSVVLQLQGLDLKPNHSRKNIMLDKYLSKIK